MTADVTYTAQWKRIYRPTPSTPTVEIPDDDALGLNTDDHFAYIIGYPDGTVQPNGQITRAEATTIFFRLLTEESRSANLTKTNGYTDVASDAWYNTAASTMTTSAMPSGPLPTSSGRRCARPATGRHRNSKQSGKKNGSTKCSRSFMLF